MQQLIWCLIALLLVYGSWQFLCALRSGSKQRVLSPLEAKSGPLRGLSDELFNYAPIPEQEPTSGQTVTVYANGQTEGGIRDAAKKDALDPAFDPFALELELQRMRREIGSMREVFEAQQREIDILRADIKRLTEPKAGLVPEPTEPDVSPEYDEALALARRGVLANVIAARCGITQAEADLVASLAARNRRESTPGEFL
ncbi:MAG: DUF2802 domain-containing protein [Azoarcus sp.]|jgi:hypothetical protein|nr:DUF2802 domain-containing protein [Azoarcus sp.]